MRKKILIAGSIVGALAATAPVGPVPARADEPVPPSPNTPNNLIGMDEFNAPGASNHAEADAELALEQELAAGSAQELPLAFELKTVEEYNELIQAYESSHPELTVEQLASDTQYMSLILCRHIVKSAGHAELAKKAAEDPGFSAMLTWLFNDYEMLRYMTDNGVPEAAEGSKSYKVADEKTWQAALDVLNKLYAAHRDDVVAKAGNQAPLNKRMMAATALTHSIRIKHVYQLCPIGHEYKWDHDSEPVGRYEVFKRLYEHGMLVSSFDKLNMAELRMVFGIPVDNNELQWINWYYHNKVWNNTDYLTNPLKFDIGYARPLGGMFPYGTYDHRPNMLGAHYYAQENYQKWNEKYHFEHHDEVYDFKVDYGYKDNDGKTYYSPIWMTLDTDGVCWDISYTSWIGYGALGAPSAYIYQPGHASFLTYSTDDQGKSYWGSGYDLYGMRQSGKKTGGSSYMPLGWGDLPWTDFYNVGYCFIGMDASKSLYGTDFQQAQNLNFIGDYRLSTGQAQEALDTFVKGVEAQYINLGSWDGIARSCKALSKGADVWMELARGISERLKLFPLPVFDYVYNYIAPELANDPVKRYTLLAELEASLNKSIEAARTDTMLSQPKYVIELAEYCRDWRLAKPLSFSLNTRAFTVEKSFLETDVDFEFSFDGGATWHRWSRGASEHSYELPEVEFAKINVDQDVLYRAVGSQASFRVDITPQKPPVSNGQANTLNDDEDVFMNVQKGIEYSTDEGAVWQPLTSKVSFEGDQAVWIRWGHQTHKFASEPLKLQFTKGEGTAERSYIKSQNGKIKVVSAPEQMKNSKIEWLIDGKPETEWVNKYTVSYVVGDSGTPLPKHEHEFVFELEKPTYLSALEYDPAKPLKLGTAYYSGSIRSCEVYVSIDGSTWTLAGSSDNWSSDTKRKKLELGNPSLAKYVKVKTSQVGIVPFAGAECGLVSVGDFRFFENYQVRSLGVKALELNDSEARKDYKVGDRIDFSGMKVTATYENDTKAIIPAAALDWDVDVFDKAGACTVTGIYEGKHVSLNVQIANNDRVATKIDAVVVEPDRTFYAGEDLPKDALQVKVSGGNESWYLLPSEFAVNKKLEVGKSTYTIALVASSDLTAQVDITAETGVKDLSVQAVEGFSGNYVLGDSFDYESAVVTLTRADGSIEPLAPERYTLNVVTQVKDEQGKDKEHIAPIAELAETPGQKKIRFTLKDHSLHADLSVMVLPYIESAPFTFEVNDKGTVCAVTGFNPEPGYETETVVIPASVEHGGKSYPVESISTGAFATASAMTSVQLPGSIKTVASGAFSNCTELRSVLMIEHKSLSGFKCEDDAFAKPSDAYVYLHPSAGSESPIAGYKVGDISAMAASLEVVAPERTHFSLGEELNTEGMEVYGVLKNGTKVPAVGYEISGYDKDTVGEQTVTVSMPSNEKLNATFKVQVEFAKIVLDEQPIGGAYRSLEDVKPLSVAVSVPFVEPQYQWYFQSSESGTPEAISGATNAGYQPDKEGLYYAEIYVQDKTGATHPNPKLKTDVVHVDVDASYVASVNGKGFSNVLHAVDRTSGDVTVEMLCDSTLENTVKIEGRAVRINGNGYTLTRGRFSDEMFRLNRYDTAQSLTLNEVVVDGGVKWSGEIDPILGRGTVDVSGREKRRPIINARGTKTSLTLVRTLLQNNYSNMDSEGGGAVYVRDNVTFKAREVGIRNCATSAYGGAVWAKHKNVDSLPFNIAMSNIEISGCSAAKNGGGLFVGEKVAFEGSNMLLRGNKADGNGGGASIDTAVASVNLSNISMMGNGAQYGGGMDARVPVELRGTSLTANSAEVSGGAVYSTAAFTLSDGSEARGNISKRDGGAIYGTNVRVSDSSLVDNEASADGGAVYAQELSTSSALFEQNKSRRNGGAAHAGKVSATRGSFIGNASDGNGGAVYAQIEFSQNGALFNENDSKLDGDAAFLTTGAKATVFSRIDQEVFCSTLGDEMVRVLTDLKGASLRLATDAPLTADTVIAGATGQTGELNITMNGGKLRLDGAKLKLADGWMDVTPFRSGKNGFTAPTQDGKVFAGWFTTDDPTKMSSKTALGADVKSRRVAFAKFVDKNVLGLKFQTNAGVKADDARANIRMLSSVDSLVYQKVGFLLSINDGPVTRGETSKAYPYIYAGVRGGADELLPQKTFCEQSSHFTAYELRNVPQSAFESRLSVTPFWVTFDGTEVQGDKRTEKVGDLVRTSSSMYDAGQSHAE
ncbi:MAG: bacterial Ig-like domain-containing protein [Coriobacteriaceae bacterium]|nr:bacterial Ig-like domain-containing protein [Coriobacteriaceae bacterium]